MRTIYDRASKRCISISKPTTIMLINGLYGTSYPLDSQVTYNWTEHHDDDLRKTLSDTIITINESHSYHIEFQMYEDGKIIMRVFDYGYRHDLTQQTDPDILEFPEPVIVYLYEDSHVPEYQELLIRFGSHGTFTYRVPTIRYLKMDREELERRKLIVLIPFQLLRLREAIEKKRTPENLEALKILIRCDILESIDKNVAAGNITVYDARILKGITWQLYRHIYKKYDEMEDSGVNQLVEEAMILEVDILEKQHREEMKRVKADMVLEMDILEKQHRQEMEQARADMVLEIDVLEKQHRQEMDQARADMVLEIDVLEKQHRQEMNQARADMAAEVDVLEKQHRQAMDQAKADMAAEIDVLEKQHRQAMDQARADMAAEVDVLEKQHRQAMDQARASADEIIQKKDNAIREKEDTIKKLSERLRDLGVSDSDIPI